MNNDLIFKNIKFKNFLSFGNQWTEIDLARSGVSLLSGENLDKGGSSGAGKTTIINALSYVLFDKIPTGVSKERLINRTNHDKKCIMEVAVTFFRGADKHVIRRWRGSSIGVQLLVNDKDITPASVNRGDDSFNTKIEELVGFSFLIFSMVISFNGNSQAFLDMSAGIQRTIIEELLKITLLSKKAVFLKKQISETERAIEFKQLLNNQIKKQNETYQKHLADAHARVDQWEKLQTESLQLLTARAAELRNFDFVAEEKIHNDIVEFQSLLDKSHHTKQAHQLKLQVIQKEASPVKDLLRENEHHHRQLQTAIISLDNEIEHLQHTRCPYCLQAYHDAKTKLSVIQLTKAENLTKLTENEIKLTSLAKTQADFDLTQRDKINDLTKIITEANTQDSLLRSQLSLVLSDLRYQNLQSLLQAKNHAANMVQQLITHKEEINPHLQAFHALKTEGETPIDTAILDDLVLLGEHQKFLLKLLVDKNSFVRKNIITQTVPFLNSRLSFYIEKLNLPHRIEFVADLSCQISEIGRDLDHGNLSNGEKKRLNFALCLAFRDVLMYMHTKINILFTDEIDGGSISGVDLESLIDVIKAKTWEDQLTTLIISHREEFEKSYDNRFIVRKENGFSTLVESQS